MILNVSSEIGILKKVVVHRPDRGIALVSPKRSEELLFDDIVHLPKMQEEHDNFVEILHAFVGKENVLDTRDLIAEGLDHDEESRKELIEMVASFEELPSFLKERLEQMDTNRLTQVLVTGYDEEENYVYFDPIPNFIFTRDIGVAINDHILITKASKTARQRENLLTRFFLWAHPVFASIKKEGRLINLNNIEDFPPSSGGERISIEGGDVMIINEETLLVGTSERSTGHAFHSIKEALFTKNVVENVVQIVVPADRSFMHIDTLFTQVDRQLFVAYKPIVSDGLSSYVKAYGKNGTVRTYPSIREYLHAEIDPKIDFVFGGDGRSPFQEREQWTDACNLLTLKPGVAIAYDRNPQTEESFKRKGYQIKSSRELLASFRTGEIHPESIEKTIITLESGELSRARGGSHCMSFPIARKPL